MAAQEVELERMLIRLVGDGSSFQKMIDTAVKTSQAAADSIKVATDQIQKFQGSIKDFATGVAGSLASLGVVSFLSGARKAFEDFERDQMLLRTAIEGNGAAIEKTMEIYEKFAASIGRVTTTSKMEALSMLKRAELYGLTGDMAKAAVKNAIALAAATGSSSQETIRATIAMAQGNYHMLRHIQGFRGLRTEQELQEAFLKKTNQGWKQAEIMGKTNEASLKRLSYTFAELKREIGRVLSESLKPMVEWIQLAADWFKELDPGIKKTIVTVGALAASFVALKASMPVLLPLLSLIASPLKLIGSAIAAIAGLGAVMGGVIVAALAAIAVVIAVVVDRLGGWEATWMNMKEVGQQVLGYVGEKFTEFMDFIEPILDALESLWETTWGLMSDAATATFNWLSDAWSSTTDFLTETMKSLGLNFEISWTSIRDHIRDVILFAEFTMKNFGQVMEYVWVSSMASFFTMANSIQFFFTDTIPAVISWLTDDWKNIFMDLFTWTGTVLTNLVTNIVAIFSNLPGLIAGTTNWDEVWKPLTEGFERKSKELILPDRKMGDLEKTLHDKARELGAKLDKDFDAFREEHDEDVFWKKMLKPIPDPVKKSLEKDALETGNGIGQAMGRGLRETKLDAILFGSLGHLELYQRQIETVERIRSAATPDVKGEATGSIKAEAAGSISAQDRFEKQQTYWERMANGIDKLAGKPTVEVEAADLPS
jgi:hypothetical protein